MLTEMVNIYVAKRLSQNSRHRPLNADVVHCFSGHLAQCIAAEGWMLTEIVRIALGVRRDRRRCTNAASCLRHDAAQHIYINKWRARRARHLFIYIGEELLKGGWGEVLGGFGVNS